MIEYYTVIKNTVQFSLKTLHSVNFPEEGHLQPPWKTSPEMPLSLCGSFCLLPHPHSHLQLTIELCAYQQSSEFVPKRVYTFGTCHCNSII